MNEEVAELSALHAVIVKGPRMTSVVGRAILVCRRQADDSWTAGALIRNYDASLEQ